MNNLLSPWINCAGTQVASIRHVYADSYDEQGNTSVNLTLSNNATSCQVPSGLTKVPSGLTNDTHRGVGRLADA